MGDDLAKGTTYTDGQQVTAGNLNAHVDDATIKYTAISSRPLKSPASMGDELLINDGGVLKKITLQQIQELTNAPSGSVMDYAGILAPSGWLFCFGQTISRTTYANLFTAIGTTYGAGDGSTTFVLPDCRGRVTAGKDNMGGTSADRLTTPINGDTLGAAGGAEIHTLTVAQMPGHTHADSGHGHVFGGSVSNLTVTAGPVGYWATGGGHATAISNATAAIQSTGGGGSHPNVQPTIVFNKIIKI